MTLRDDQHAELIRRELRGAVDGIEPAGDGLDRIRLRIAEPWLKRQTWLFLTECRDAGEAILAHSYQAADWARAARDSAAWRRLRAGLRFRSPSADGDRGRAGGRRHLPGHRSPRGGFPGSLRPVLAWLRPALAVAGAVLLVAAGAYALGQLRANLIEISLLSPYGGAAPVSSPHHVPPSGSHPAGIVTGPTVHPTHHHAHHARRVKAAPSCTPGPHASPSPTISPPASPGSTGTPTPRSGPSPSGTSGITSSPASGTPVSRPQSCAQPGPTTPTTSYP